MTVIDVRVWLKNEANADQAKEFFEEWAKTLASTNRGVILDVDVVRVNPITQLGRLAASAITRKRRV